METEQIRTFMAVAAHGSFLEAAARVHVTQSTVSTRIQSLESFLAARLFNRTRDGAVLTPAGERFLKHAKDLLRILDQAKNDVSLPSRFSDTVVVGARIALWYELLPRWTAEMRRDAPEVALRAEIGFEEDLMRRVVEGTMDIALMYTPQFSLGVKVTHLFDENLILLSDDPSYRALVSHSAVSHSAVGHVADDAFARFTHAGHFIDHARRPIVLVTRVNALSGLAASGHLAVGP